MLGMIKGVPHTREPLSFYLTRVDLMTQSVKPFDPFLREEIPAHVRPEQVFDFNIFNPQHDGMDLFASIHRLHELGLPEIFWTRNNGGHWIPIRSGPIQAIVRDTDTFSSKRWHVPASMDYDTEFYVPFMSDPPEHAGYRKIANILFAPKRISAMEQGIREFTRQLLDEFYPTGGCEFISEFASQMPVIVFLRLLDLPLEDRQALLKVAEMVTRPPSKEHNRNDAFNAIVGYLGPILEERRRNPGDDVLSGLVHAELPSGRSLSTDELHGMAAVILTGGLDTVASSLGMMARHLAEAPEHRQQIVHDPKITPKAIDEMLRRFSVITRGRRVKHDTEFRGLQLKAEDRIVWGASMFGLDDEINPDPMTTDFNRPKIQHETFGNGIHFCIGANLARLEFKVFLEEWLQRIPDFWVDPEATVEYRPGIVIGLKSLPLRWNVT